MESAQVKEASPNRRPSFSEQQALDASAQESSELNGPEPVTGAKLLLLLTSLTLAAFLIFLDSSIISTVNISISKPYILHPHGTNRIVCQAIPKITDEFNSLKDVGWYGSAYQLGRYRCHPTLSHTGSKY